VVLGTWDRFDDDFSLGEGVGVVDGPDDGFAL